MSASQHVCVCTPHAQAGLSALKTPQSLAESCSREDPLHLPAFRALASRLPFAKHVHSKLVCAVTKQIMDEHNPPFVSQLLCFWAPAGAGG